MKYDNEHKFEELAQRLEKRPTLGNDILNVISRCRDGSYHDFQSEFATPKLQMVLDLRAAGLENDAQTVIDGEYDQ